MLNIDHNPDEFMEKDPLSRESALGELGCRVKSQLYGTRLLLEYLERESESELQKNVLSQLIRSNNNLSRLLESALITSVADEGDLHKQSERFCLAELVSSCIESMNSTSVESMTLNKQENADFIYFGNKRMILQGVTNMLELVGCNPSSSSKIQVQLRRTNSYIIVEAFLEESIDGATLFHVQSQTQGSLRQSSFNLYFCELVAKINKGFFEFSKASRFNGGKSSAFLALATGQ